jgi:hypothetical protein
MLWIHRSFMVAMVIAFVWIASLVIEAGVACTRGERMVLAAQGIIGIALCATEGGFESMRRLRFPGIK